MGRGYAALILPPVLFFGVFFAWPLGRVVWRSVMEPQPSLANYAKVLSGGPYLRVLLFTLQTAATVTLVCVLIGYPVAALLARMRGPAGSALVGLIVASLWTSAVVRSYAWMILFQRFGIINQALVGLGLVDEPIRILQTPAAVDVGMVHILLPFMLLPLITTMRRMDGTLLRAGQMLGAGPVMLFVRVYLPLSLPGVAAGVVLVFISALGFFITPALLGGGRTPMAAMMIEEQASTYLNWPLACTLATILLAMTLAIYALFQLISRRPTARALR
jgi:putative spermidine/putrescine transport system permease protein/mannopine transport system permease protein